MTDWFSNTYFSQVNYDVSRGTPWSLMNTHMNYAWTDMNARMSLYNVPLYSFGGFTQYPLITGDVNWMLNPSSAFGQFQFANGQIGNGTNASNISWNNLPSWDNMGWNGSSSSSSSATSSDPAEAATQKKVAKLKSLLTQLIKEGAAGDKDSDLYTEINTIITRTVGSIKPDEGETKADAQLRVLKEAYNKLNPNKVKDTLIKIGLNASGNGSNSLDKLLEAAGYEDTKTRNSNLKGTKMIELKNALDGLKSASSSFPTIYIINEGLTGNPNKKDGYQVLDFISAWNSKESLHNQNIMEFIISIYKRDIGDEHKASLHEQAIKPLVEALVQKAQFIMESGELDEKSNKRISTLVTKVENNLKAPYSNLAYSFNQLYKALRTADTLIIQKQVLDYYEFIGDTRVFGNNLFTDRTAEDLKNEGLGGLDSDIKLGDGTTPTSGSGSTSGSSDSGSAPSAPIDVNATLDENIDTQLLNGVITEIETEGQALTKLKEALGENFVEGARYFYINMPNGEDQQVVTVKDGKLVKLPVVFKDNDFTVAADADFTQVQEFADADIQAHDLSANKKASHTQLNELTTGDNPVLTKRVIGGYVYYEETTATGSYNGNSYKKLYVVTTDGKINEKCGCFIEDNTVKEYRNNPVNGTYKETATEEISAAADFIKNPSNDDVLAKVKNVQLNCGDSKGQDYRYVTDKTSYGVFDEATFSKLYNDPKAKVIIKCDLDKSYGYDWTSKGHEKELTTRVKNVGNTIIKALAQTGLDFDILQKALNEVLSWSIYSTNPEGTSRYDSTDDNPCRDTATRRLYEKFDNEHGLLDYRDFDGYDSDVWGINFKLFVDDILEEYKKIMNN